MVLSYEQSEIIYIKIQYLLNGPIYKLLDPFEAEAINQAQVAAERAKQQGKSYKDKKQEIGALGGALGGLTKRFKKQVKTAILLLFIEELHNLNLLKPSETTAHTAKQIMKNNNNIFYDTSLSTQTLYEHFGRKDMQGKVGNSGEFSLCEEHRKIIEKELDTMLKKTRDGIRSSFKNTYKSCK